MSPNVTLYLGQDTGLDANWADASPTERQAIQQKIESTITELSGLGYNVYILAFLHVRPGDGGGIQLIYNGTPVDKLYPGLGEQLARLKAKGTRLLLSIGGWDNSCDFTGIQSVGPAAFLAQARKQVITPLGLDGIDLDLEPTADSGYYCPVDKDGWNGIYQRFSPLLVEISRQAAALGLLVTHAPAVEVTQFYTDPGGILEASRRASGNSIAWLNYQTYNAGTQEAQWFEDFVSAIDPGRTGIMNPAGFVSAGFGIADDLNDSAVVAGQNIDELRAKYGQIGGAFVWRYTGSQVQITDWATVLSKALASG